MKTQLEGALWQKHNGKKALGKTEDANKGMKVYTYV